MTRLETLLDSARTDVNATLGSGVAQFDSTQRGEPSNLTLFKGVAYWYEGFQESSTGGNSLTKVNIQEKITIRWYIPVISRDAGFAERQEDQMQAANAATLTQLWSDPHLSAAPDVIGGLEITGSSTAWQAVNEQWSRVLSIPVLIDLSWVATIG